MVEVHLSDERRDPAIHGGLVDLRRWAVLEHSPAPHHGDAIGHGERLILVVGDENEGDPHLALQALQLDLHLPPQLQVERPEGLVQKEHRRLVDQCARQGHALLLAP